MKALFRNPHLLNVHLPIHLFGILAGLYMWLEPTWTQLFSFLFWNMMISGVGMSVGFHRFFCHRAFEAPRWAHWLMLICGSLACQGSVVFWTALHRHHHVFSDTETDLHSPRHGLWSAYMGWILRLEPGEVRLARASNLMRMPGVVFWHRNYNAVMLSLWAVLLTLGANATLAPYIYGFLFAQMWAIHQEAIVNSLCHTVGYRNYDVRDTSTNMWFMSLLTWGQALHNNHHGRPGASFRVRWFEIDLGMLLIFFLRKRK